MQHRADSRKLYFLFSCINLNAERARYPCSLSEGFNGQSFAEGVKSSLCKLIVLVQAPLPRFLLSLSHDIVAIIETDLIELGRIRVE